MPEIDQLHIFQEAWINWWITLQPESRQGSELLQDVELEEAWNKLCKGGPNGFFTLVASLGWWCASATSSEDKKRSGEMVLDVLWVVNQMIQGLQKKKRKAEEQSEKGTDKKR